MTTASTHVRDDAPLLALGVLDGAERLQATSHVASCGECAREVAAFERVCGDLGALSAVTPLPPELRRRVLGAVDPDLVRGARGPRWLAAAAVLAGGMTLLAGLRLASVSADRDRLLGERTAAEARAAEAQDRAVRAEAAVAALSATAGRSQSLTLVALQSGARVVPLAAQPAAPSARGAVLFDPASGQATLVASGLPVLPAGQVYEAWVIADGVPVPAGLFASDASGPTVHPVTAPARGARTFAVTIEPAGGTPAPTGPMVLAGRVS